MTSFYLIDGFNVIFRSCLVKGGPVLVNPTGEEVTTGTYFYTQTILKLCNKKPDYLAFCIDSNRKTLFRTDLYPAYKANRGDADEELSSQLKRCLEISKLLGIQVIQVSKYEADDIIATLASKYEDQVECTIFSSDKDLHQLVDSKIRLFDLLKDQYITESDILSRWKVPASQLVDLRSLIGDSSDNLKGVPGIGPKRALELILKYGTAENIQAHASEQSPAIAKSLSEANIPLLKKLTALDKNTPIDKTLEDFKFGGLPPFSPELKDLFKYLGFKRWSE